MSTDCCELLPHRSSVYSYQVMLLQADSYPPGVGATPEKLRFQIEHANEQFLVAVRSSPSGSGEEVLG